MKQQVANYSVIIEKQKRLGTNKWCYMAYVPILGVATEGESVEEAQKAIESLVNFHLDSLAQEGEKIPVEASRPILTTMQTDLPAGSTIVSA